MATQPKPVAVQTPPSPSGGLAPVPEEIEREEQQAVALREENLARLALIDPDQVERRIAAREVSLERLRTACIKSTHAFDWTLYKDRDGRVVGVLRDSGAVKVRKLMGISIFNYRPLSAQGYPEPSLTYEPDSSGKKVTVVEMYADGLCALTGEPVEGVYYALRSDDDFIGRQRKDAKGEGFTSLQDMKAACRTGLDAKVVRILSGLRKVPEETLKAQAIVLDQAHRGMGFGTSAERGARNLQEAGVKEGLDELKAEVLRRVGGDLGAVRQLTVDITKSPDGKFKGFDSLDRLTKDWQVQAAWKALRAHSVFGDTSQGERQPGVDG